MIHIVSKPSTDKKMCSLNDSHVKIYILVYIIGTISGVGQYLKNKYNEKYKKEQTETKTHQCKIILIDPPGSVLYNKVKYNIAYATEQRERNLLRHRYDTIAEGIGLDRITNNFALGVDNGVIDDAIRVSDQNAVDVAHWLLKEEGLFVGSSSAMNVCGAIRFAVSGEDGNDGNNCNDDAHSVSTCTRSSCIVAVICDGGQRHLTRFWNRDFIIDWDLLWPSDDEIAWKNRLDVIFNVNSSTTM
jgi:cysteine synthase A